MIIQIPARAERLERIVEDYNTGAKDIIETYAELMKLLADLQNEEKRHIQENLTEEELVIYDILTRPEPKLTKKRRNPSQKPSHTTPRDIESTKTSTRLEKKNSNQSRRRTYN